MTTQKNRTLDEKTKNQKITKFKKKNIFFKKQKKENGQLKRMASNWNQMKKKNERFNNSNLTNLLNETRGRSDFKIHFMHCIESKIKPNLAFRT